MDIPLKNNKNILVALVLQHALFTVILMQQWHLWKHRIKQNLTLYINFITTSKMYLGGDTLPVVSRPRCAKRILFLRLLFLSQREETPTCRWRRQVRARSAALRERQRQGQVGLRRHTSSLAQPKATRNEARLAAKTQFRETNGACAWSRFETISRATRTCARGMRMSWHEKESARST